MTTSSDSTSARRPWTDWLLIAVFAGLLSLPALDTFTGIDPTERPTENRVPAPKPVFAQASLAGLRDYLAGTESYFDDHFGFRKRLVRWYQQWKFRLFRDQNGAANRVVRGQDGWLFYGEEHMIDHYLGVARFSPAQLQAWQKLLEKRRDWLAARGVQYLFVIPPDKQSVYGGELPSWLQKAAPAHRETKLDQLLAYMHAHSTVTILDLREPLMAARSTAPTYLQDDTHWNAFGAFVACQEIVRTLAPQVAGLPLLRLDDFTWTNVPWVGGDLSVMLGTHPAESNYFSFSPKPAIVFPELRAAPELISIYQHHYTNIISENPAPLTATAVVFHDSYGAVMRPFLGCSFKCVAFMWDGREFNPGVINARHPNVVINEMLERLVNVEDPVAMMAKDALP